MSELYSVYSENGQLPPRSRYREIIFFEPSLLHGGNVGCLRCPRVHVYLVDNASHAAPKAVYKEQGEELSSLWKSAIELKRVKPAVASAATAPVS